MITVELFSGDDCVLVEVGSQPEAAWRAKGFSEKGKKAVEEQPEVVDVAEEHHVARKPGRPASKRQ